MGTVNTTLSKILLSLTNNLIILFFILIRFDGLGDYVIDHDRDHDIDNNGFHEISSVAICLMIFR
jgi:hypothetical protein